MQSESFPFEKDFSNFSHFIRQKFSMKSLDQWEMGKLYLVLQNHAGGFFLKIENVICLGVRIKENNSLIFAVEYKDPRYTGLKEIIINGKNLMTQSNKLIKIQWFGLFSLLLAQNLLPSFSILKQKSYFLTIPKRFLESKFSDLCLAGDWIAFVAEKSSVSYFTT